MILVHPGVVVLTIEIESTEANDLTGFKEQVIAADPATVMEQREEILVIQVRKVIRNTDEVLEFLASTSRLDQMGNLDFQSVTTVATIAVGAGD